MKNSYVKFLKLGSVYSIGNLAENALKIFLIPLYTAYLPPEEYGVLALLTLTISLLTVFVVTPITSACTRFYYKPDYQDRNTLLLFNLFLFLALQLIGVALLYWNISDFLCRLLFADDLYLRVVRLSTVVLILTPISRFFQKILMLTEQAKFYVVVSLCQFVLSVAATVYFLVIARVGIIAVIYGNILGLSFIVMMILPYVLKHSQCRVRCSILKEPLIYGYPLVVSGFSNKLIQAGDRYILRLFESVSTVGIYSFGYQIAGMIQIVLGEPVKHALMPLVLQKENHAAEQKKILIILTTYYYTVALFLTLLCSLFAKELIMLFASRQEFWTGWKIVPIIMFSYSQQGLGYFLVNGLTMTQKSYHISGLVLLSAGMNIGLNCVFIPLWGMLGAAVATLISFGLWNGLKIYYSAKFYDLHFELKRLAHITVVGIGLYLLSLIVMTVIPNILTLIGIKLLLLIGYPALLFLTGLFSEQEKDIIRNIIDNLRLYGIRITLARFKKI